MEGGLLPSWERSQPYKCFSLGQGRTGPLALALYHDMGSPSLFQQLGSQIPHWQPMGSVAQDAKTVLTPPSAPLRGREWANQDSESMKYSIPSLPPILRPRTPARCQELLGSPLCSSTTQTRERGGCQTAQLRLSTLSCKGQGRLSEKRSGSGKFAFMPGFLGTPLRRSGGIPA